MADTKLKTGNKDNKSGMRTTRTSDGEKSVSARSKGESSENKIKSVRSDSDLRRIKKLSEDGISGRNEMKKKERDPAREQRKSRDRNRGDSDSVTIGSNVDKERKSRSKSDVNRESRKATERNTESLNSVNQQPEKSKQLKQQREFSRAREEEPRRDSDVVSRSRSRSTDNTQVEPKTSIKNDCLESFISKEKPKKTSRSSKSVMSSESKNVSRGKSLVDSTQEIRDVRRSSKVVTSSSSLDGCQTALDDNDTATKSGSETETEDEHLKKLKERQGMNRQKNSTTSRSRSSSRGLSSESRSRSSERLPINVTKHPDHRSSGTKNKNDSSSPKGSFSLAASSKKELNEHDNIQQIYLTSRADRADSDLSSIQFEEAVVKSQPDDDDDHLRRIKERQNLIRQKHGASTTNNRSRSLSRTRGVSRTRSSDGMDKTLVRNSVTDTTTNKTVEPPRSVSRARGVSQTRSRDGTDMARVRNSVPDATTNSVDEHSQRTTDENDDDGEDDHLKRIKERQNLIRQRPTAQARSRSLSRTRGIARTSSSDGLPSLNSDNNNSRGRSRSRNNGGSIDSTSDHEKNSRSGSKSGSRSGRSSSRQGRGTKDNVGDGHESETSEADDIDSDGESEKQTTNFLSFLKFTNPNLAKQVNAITKTGSEPVRSVSMTTSGLSRLIGGMGFRKSSGDNSVCPDDTSVVSKQPKQQKKKSETDNQSEIRSDRSGPRKPIRSENILGNEAMMGNSSWDEENEFDFGFNPKPPARRESRLIDATGVLQDNAKKSSSTAQSRAHSIDGSGPILNMPVPPRQRGLSRNKSIDSNLNDFLDFRRSFK